MSAEFVPALELNRQFYVDAVGPLLAGVPHAAGRLGWGSEVLGLDTARSTDHGWGPQLAVFVEDDAVADVQAAVDDGLPVEFGGWPVRYGWDDKPVVHHVTVTTLRRWLAAQLGIDPLAAMSTADWLVIPQQKLLEVTAGAVYHDDSGELTRVRAQLARYPDDVWLWMVAAQWRRIAQEEAFVGRTAEVGDDLGSRVVAARLARELMRLWFLFERTYWPYTKWFGSAFARLPGSAPLGRALDAAVAAPDYAAREAGLVMAYRLVADRHNALGVTDVVESSTQPYYGRPFQVLMAHRFAEACMERLGDSALLELPGVGSVDQVADSTDLLSYAQITRRLLALYET